MRSVFIITTLPRPCARATTSALRACSPRIFSRRFTASSGLSSIVAAMDCAIAAAPAGNALLDEAKAAVDAAKAKFWAGLADDLNIAEAIATVHKFTRDVNGLLARGAGREAAIRSLQAAGLDVNMIKDVTPIPHKGCRPPKRRRV